MRSPDRASPKSGTKVFHSLAGSGQVSNLTTTHLRSRLRYASKLNIGDSVINITNAGTHVRGFVSILGSEGSRPIDSVFCTACQAERVKRPAIVLAVATHWIRREHREVCFGVTGRAFGVLDMRKRPAFQLGLYAAAGSSSASNCFSKRGNTRFFCIAHSSRAFRARVAGPGFATGLPLFPNSGFRLRKMQARRAAVDSL